jgi:hypothetical protein
LFVHCEMLAELKLAVVNPDTVNAFDEIARPEPVMSESQSPFTFNDPAYWLPVVVALPTMVEEAVERKPPLNEPTLAMERAVVEAYGRTLTAVVVARMFPTVSWDEVAAKPLPAELATRMALLGKVTVAVKVPDVVTGELVTVNPDGRERPTEVTVPEPLPLPTHVPDTAKHPAVMLNPTFDVEVAWPMMFNPAMVVVPKPSVEMERRLVDEPTEKAVMSPASGLTEKRDVGVVVPTPTNPLLLTMSEVAVDEPTTN